MYTSGGGQFVRRKNIKGKEKYSAFESASGDARIVLLFIVLRFK
jgi:hypothetical protein